MPSLLFLSSDFDMLIVIYVLQSSIVIDLCLFLFIYFFKKMFEFSTWFLWF